MTAVSFHRRATWAISDVARVSGLTARAIRLYEGHGLVAAGRDGNNARLFDEAAVQRLLWIAALRRAGVAIAEIREVFHAESEAGEGMAWLGRILEERRRAATEVLEQIAELLQGLDRLPPLVCAGPAKRRLAGDAPMAAAG